MSLHEKRVVFYVFHILPQCIIMMLFLKKHQTHFLVLSDSKSGAVTKGDIKAVYRSGLYVSCTN